MDRSTIEQLQMHGQDIPWLLQHWADTKPDHPALVWEPRRRRRRDAGPTPSSLADVRAARRRARATAASSIGDKVLIHAENCPEMLLAWLACATVGAVAVTTNTQVGRRPRSATSPSTRSASPRSRSRSSSATSAPRAATCGGSRSSATTAASRRRRRSRSTFDDLRGDADVVDGPRDRAAAPVRDHVHVGHDEQARRRSCTRTPTRSGRAASARATSTSAPTTAT